MNGVDNLVNFIFLKLIVYGNFPVVYLGDSGKKADPR